MFSQFISSNDALASCLKVVMGTADAPKSLPAHAGTAVISPYTLPSGYTPIGVLSYRLSSNKLTNMGLQITSVYIRADVYNITDSAIDNLTMTATVLCVKKDVFT